ncbi:hypothetical protein FA743_00810 [Paracoccus gahaiensis]|uniref:Phage tail protein n=1 Tax=Paracoccus gahaiensis TaxID=1706839 RepID=A0A4V5MVZ3_9RHOB|nr:hypothetical protein [Paracoccus gahaiensis]TJZ93848.1 hypothetical protein FA743_00810 [Paracoccus gahaiensis]
MLFPVAGSRFFIADQPASSPSGPVSVPAGAWVEIGETEAFGTLGGRYELHEANHIDPLGDGYTAMKGVHSPDTMQIVMGLDPTDPGQLLLFNAYRSRDAFPFRLLFPDGVTDRQWFALVMSFGEVFDAANNVMRMQADLHPVTNITR